MTAKIKSVYEDLNYANADEMLIKARLVTEIADQVKRRHLTQTEASELLGFSQPKLSNLLRGQFRGVSEKKLMECLTRLGRDIEIVVRPAPRSRRAGKITVEVS
ncbi:MAG: helix-turn-helix domain-containing protein [Methylocella sp.]